MLIVVLVRALALGCRGHHDLVLENLALRQQSHTLRRAVKPPRTRPAEPAQPEPRLVASDSIGPRSM
jgi:hypothetical protein